MKVTLSGKQVDISDKLRKHVEDGVSASVDKYFSAPISYSVAFPLKERISVLKSLSIRQKTLFWKVRVPRQIRIRRLIMLTSILRLVYAATNEAECTQEQNRFGGISLFRSSSAGWARWRSRRRMKTLRWQLLKPMPTFRYVRLAKPLCWWI